MGEEKLEDKHVVIPVSTLASSMAKKLDDYNFRNRNPPTIYKVHADLRGTGSHDYDPKLVCIGPFHDREKPELAPMEHLKWMYLQDLLNRNPQHNKLESYIDAVSSRETLARRQYSVDIGLKPEQFVEMLVLDGCFILEFLLKRAFGPVGPPFSEVKWNLPFLRNDLLLLENQIPFFVVRALFDKSDVPGLKGLKNPSLMGLALHYVARGKLEEKDFAEECLPGVFHLLHLSHICQEKNFVDPNQTHIAPSCGYLSKVRRSVSGLLVTAFYYFISFLLMWKRPRHRPSSKKKGDKAPRMIPSATKLREAGVSFKRKESTCLLNVSFRKEDGILEIPFLSVQENTIATLRNLIAFEQCCPAVPSRFTAYAVFMDNIVDTPEDVAILVESGIIESKLGSGEEVAQLINGLRKGTCLGYDKHYLVQLFKDVRDYCESDRHRWRAQLMHGYFSNPWARISFIGGVLILAFTALQTVFTMLGYWKGGS